MIRLTADGVASLLRVRVDTVYSYVSRGIMPGGQTCPCCGSGPTWGKAEIEQWAKLRPGRTGRPKKPSRIAAAKRDAPLSQERSWLREEALVRDGVRCRRRRQGEVLDKEREPETDQ